MEFIFLGFVAFLLLFTFGYTARKLFDLYQMIWEVEHILKRAVRGSVFAFLLIADFALFAFLASVWFKIFLRF